MTTPSREEVEARLAEARERYREAARELQQAELAYREVVPCEHPSVSYSTVMEDWRCHDCGDQIDDPRGCQHRHIDNDTWQCTSCGERMRFQNRRPETVLDAPNAVACTNPACSGDIHDPNCDNPAGLYVPDRFREREVLVAVHYSYTCQRCANDGAVFVAGELPIWECGRDHRGDSVPVREEVTA
ncbi:DUF7459 domain-containing protein [Nocardia wallacei]|uniref:DUF7459 domain-containing protein n=1 Tax=Nocardia wallacei TaxID=480035 RepID=UPI0024566D47|nr:hypothetical protein [Nocardia wallacei]